MGGGDLPPKLNVLSSGAKLPSSTAEDGEIENLKKSWHPSTMRNMEKVWKAEQRHDQEKRRIAELQREIRAEKTREDIQKFAEDTGVVEKKDDMKLDWMYKGPSGIVDREEYLLGRRIDKTFEQLEQSEKASTSSAKNSVEYGEYGILNLT
ncbi:unnamed protein product, partial [Timema podura]|nr:unnamed protein product [Timema podura]